MTIARDTGYRGRLVSLGGLVGRQGHGVKAECNSRTITTLVNNELIGSNPARLYILIKNVSAGDNTVICLGGTSAAVGFELKQGETIQFDRNMPWTGSFSILNTGGGVISWIEGSLAGE